jgi:hypothetical protein
MIEQFYKLSPVMMGVVLVALLLLGSEAGFRLGKRGASRSNDRVRSVHLTVQGALLGLLALLLGFSFAMAGARYETRKAQLVAEANALGTAYLRADLLPADLRDGVKEILKRYVETRLAAYLPGAPENAIADAVKKSEAIHAELWARTVEAGKDSSRGATNALFIAAVNGVVDVHGTRIAAGRDRVPEVILVMLVGYSMLSTGVLGYVYGLTGSRQTQVQVVFSLLIVFVILVILDLDSPRSGLIRVSQQAMLDVQASMQK